MPVDSANPGCQYSKRAPGGDASTVEGSSCSGPWSDEFLSSQKNADVDRPPAMWRMLDRKTRASGKSVPAQCLTCGHGSKSRTPSEHPNPN